MFRAARFENVTQTLQHYADELDVAITRALAIFAGIEQYRANRDGTFLYVPNNGSSTTTITPEQFKDAFLESMGAITIYEYEKPKGRTLKLNDVWLDDPIGSAGIDILDVNVLTEKQRSEVMAIFSPFIGVIYPQHVAKVYSKSDISKIYKQITRTKLGRDEMASRKYRSLSLGESWSLSKPQETIWTYLTLELRKWALSDGYDYFCYVNKHEKDGSMCYVALSDNTFGKPIARYRFDHERYSDLPASTLITRTKELALKGGSSVQIDDFIWCGQHPSDYWAKESCW
ncbi:hypothetical protein [Vibrio sp. SBT000027]|uniref:hypothetical protein n=1 Tax=Vibrio sp. SBT000027 TaxID=1803384 RepID=UPI000EF55510|nr:hypothetical protein [Vibrio sp. SBT000027]RLQ19915.1 hypothetical protein AYK60_07545 [Vibrio sp. SBT000027]